MHDFAADDDESDRHGQNDMAAGSVPTHGLRFIGTAFYVIHRRREFGPFDYNWAADLRGVDLTFQGIRYGEVCSPAQLCVDLREFRLPKRVVQVAVLVSGCLLQSLRRADGPVERQRRIITVLRQFGCARFAANLSTTADCEES